MMLQIILLPLLIPALVVRCSQKATLDITYLTAKTNAITEIRGVIHQACPLVTMDMTLLIFHLNVTPGPKVLAWAITALFLQLIVLLNPKLTPGDRDITTKQAGGTKPKIRTIFSWKGGVIATHLRHTQF